MGEVGINKILLIAFHFPPFKASSGIQRSLSMARYLRESGWEPVVLSVSPQAYSVVSDDQVGDIPADVRVIRAFGRDSTRFFSIGGRYPGVLALPDRWVSWALGGVWSGLHAIRTEKPDVIWSTFPIATAHLIGLCLHRLSGIPWVADFRDSMTEDDYPADPRQRRCFEWIERNTVRHASRLVFTAPGAQRMYEQRFPDHANRFAVVRNGYDEDLFDEARAPGEREHRDADAPMTLVHSGILYPAERDPTALFDALASAKRAASIDAARLRVVLRATAHDDLFRPMLAERGIADIVHLEPATGYAEALSEMLQADGLLLLQASNCNHQIPAKLYEYFRAGKPIVALTDPQGDTGRTLVTAGIKSITELNDTARIQGVIERFLTDSDYRRTLTVEREQSSCYSRRALVAEYADILKAAVRARP